MNCAWPLSAAEPRRGITEINVRMPDPSVDLTRPPKGVNHLNWHLSQISDLTMEEASLLGTSDIEVIFNAYAKVLARFRASHGLPEAR